jgi:hypothetical protein
MKVFYTLLVVLFLAACSGPKFMLDTEKVSFTRLLDHISENQQRIKTIDAMSRITVDSE